MKTFSVIQPYAYIARFVTIISYAIIIMLIAIVSALNISYGQIWLDIEV